MKKYLFICLVLIYITQPLFSIPAVPWPTQKQQPDGTMITVYLKGDERINWMESEDGYTLLYDDLKNIVYAKRNDNNNLIPSNILFKNSTDTATESLLKENGITQKLRYSKAQINTINQIRQMESAAESPKKAASSIVGEQKALCILVEFNDKEFIKDKSEFNNLMNQIGYSANGAKGSVKDFYKENSYGKLNFSVTVVGPYKLSNSCEYYAPSRKWSEFARSAIQAADDDVDFKDYANENNRLENLHLIFAGHGDEAIGNGKQIWSHKSSISTVTLDGVKISTYSCSPELSGGSGTSITNIGVICHELCHVFGAPDFYDADEEDGGEYDGTGNWDLMAAGSWNNYGISPAHINMYQKVQFGWVDATELTEATEITGMKNSAEHDEAYIINTSNTGEYYVLENKQKVGFDAYVPGAGLLIYHVSIRSSDIAYNSVNNTHPQRVYPVSASSTHKIPSNQSTYGSINSSNTVFNGSRPAFTHESTPAMITWESGSQGSVTGEVYKGKPVTDVKVENKLVSFKFMQAGEVSIDIDYEYSQTKNILSMSWEVSGISKTIKRYNVYQNDKLLLETTTPSFKQVIAPDATYKYGINIVYTDDTVSDIQEIMVYTGTVAIDNITSGSIAIYPNPIQTGSDLTIDLGDNNNQAELLIYDISGRLVQQKRTNSQIGTISTEDLTPGMYLIRIQTTKGTDTVKLNVR